MEKRYLVWFGKSNSYFNARFLELEGLARLYAGIEPTELYVGGRCSALSTDPFAIIRLPNDEAARRICSRSVLVKFIIELWGDGVTDENVIASVQSAINDESWTRLFSGPSFSYRVVTYGAQLCDKDRRDRMSSYSCLFRGYERVDLKNPDLTLVIIDEHEVSFAQTGTRDELIPADRKRTFYGRLIADADNEVRQRLNLKGRPVLGPTSLDNDLAFLMANVGEISEGDLVLDPFCGTGGLLLAATACSKVPPVGSDIDIRVLKGEYVSYVNTKAAGDSDTRRDIFRNFENYKLVTPEIIANDNNNHCWKRSSSVFDVVLTDPPYGVRAGAKKIGQKFEHEVGNRDNYHPQMLGYTPDEVNGDLLRLSAELLTDNGLLVFLLHIELMHLFTDTELAALPRDMENNGGCTKILRQRSGREYVYANETARDWQFLNEDWIIKRVVPHHPAFSVEGVALQILAAGTGRVLVKMRRSPRSSTF